MRSVPRVLLRVDITLLASLMLMSTEKSLVPCLKKLLDFRGDKDENTLHEMVVQDGQDWVFVHWMALNVDPEINY